MRELRRRKHELPLRERAEAAAAVVGAKLDAHAAAKDEDTGFRLVSCKWSDGVVLIPGQHADSNPCVLSRYRSTAARQPNPIATESAP